MPYFRKFFVNCLALSLIAINSHADGLTIDIVKSSNNTTPIAIVPFVNDPASESLNSIISDDLARSGLFVPAKQFPERPSSSSEFVFPVWQVLGLDYVVVGKVSPNENNQSTIQYELVSSSQEKRLLGESMTIPATRWREAAHFISDRVFKYITGIDGSFSTRVAYVLQYTSEGKIRYRLDIADADGHQPRSILDSDEPILSPSWSPDGQNIAYVSFEGGKPAIYTQNLATQQRQIITKFKGLNGAPAWSPDGSKLALTLSQDGNPEIYLFELANKKLTRLTNHYAIDTEARWFPDGRALIFTSDRGGNPQIYRLDINTQDVKRLTFEGSFNGRGAISPDGRYLAMVHRRSGQNFQIALQDLQTGGVTRLTDTPLDEAPSFSPNSQMIVYATKQGAKGVLGIMSLDGRFKLQLPASDGQVREPAWSP